MEDSILDALSALGTVSSYDKKVQTAYNSLLEIIKESTFVCSKLRIKKVKDEQAAVFDY